MNFSAEKTQQIMFLIPTIGIEWGFSYWRIGIAFLMWSAQVEFERDSD